MPRRESSYQIKPEADLLPEIDYVSGNGSHGG